LSANDTPDGQNPAAYQRGVASFWESETTRTREKVQALERQKRELIGRLNDMDELLSGIHDRLIKTGHHDCEECEGTGGIAEVYEVITRDGWSISHAEQTGWTSPSEEECDSCDGTGINFK
jgi:hypothetical protein